MKIKSIELIEIKLPLVHFFETSFGRTYEREIIAITQQSKLRKCILGRLTEPILHTISNNTIGCKQEIVP
jgi:hypothetical protein